MTPDLALQAIDAVRADHITGHTCADGKWYNARAGSNRVNCPVWYHLRTATSQVERLGTQVHDAAHTLRHVEYVTRGLLAGTDLTDLPPEQAEGWMQMARQAIEALAWSLENNDTLTERARRIQERV